MPSELIWVLENLESPGKKQQGLDGPGNFLKSNNKVFKIYVIRYEYQLQG